MQENSNWAKKSFPILGVVIVVVLTVVLIPGIRRWRQETEIKKQPGVSGSSSKNVNIDENSNGFVPKGTGTIER